MIKDQQVKGPRGGFTLIELLAVIAIIGILVGVVIGVGGNVRQKAAKSRAKAEIAAIELALERYKIDNGDYPNWPGIGGSDVYTGNPSNYEASLVDSGVPYVRSRCLLNCSSYRARFYSRRVNDGKTIQLMGN